MTNISDLKMTLEKADYFADEEILYALMGAIDTNLPLLIEGDPGVGKSSLALALAKGYNIPLMRVQCYDGISPDSIMYDYDYQRMLLVVSAVRDKLNEAMKDLSVAESVKYVSRNLEFYGEEFLLDRPILRALRDPGRKVLLIDEIDKATEEIEHTLLEVLSDFAMTIPEYKTIVCNKEDMPIVILTSNRFRELSAPLKRRCVYLFINQKTKEEIKHILRLKVSDDDAFCERIATYLEQINTLTLQHPTSISEGIAWAKFLRNSLDITSESDIEAAVKNTIGFLAKDNADRKVILSKVFGR